ncbi:autotransporter assembly complex protein TamA [Sedimentitalea arenosa]|uniref:BamA/TamA family outer membrane protein n=1 Tax=Sedimentitalea arenosa TaxID=2798803 RepID=A0A8J7LZM5_9RHOB|nr:BamA/TamA family outer membrane protein [Arenibacterium arenosum]MBJ6371321.1 BamA/TamA family outer membrane protein [Arenibacterium arenosum]
MNTAGRRTRLSRSLFALWLCCAPGLAMALTTTLKAPGAPEDVEERLSGSSSVMSAESNGLTKPQELIAAALSDYRTLVQVMYDEGYFAPVVTIRVDGREAALIPVLEPPRSIDTIAITVQPGRKFTFGTARIAPVAPDTDLPEGFRSGETATTGVLRDAASAGVLGWRDVGHAKADVGPQKITARNSQAKLDADITLLPGPKLRFGRLTVPQNSAVRPEAIAKIAAFPSGEQFSPAMVQRVGTRLRRTGAFSTVSIREAETPNPDGTLDFEALVEDQAPRRISLGGEIASETGVELSAQWIHRNLFGNAERFLFDARVRNIGGEEDIDGAISFRLDRPARFGGDDNQFYLGGLSRDNQPNYSLTRAYLGAGVRRTFSDQLFAEASILAEWNDSDDAFGDGRVFKMIPLPVLVEWDLRDNKVNATDGFFIRSTLTPYLGLSGTESGTSIVADARGYLGFGANDRVVLAGRVQLGSVVGPSLADISPQYLFYSGGAGTVRGQPYESLGIPVNNGLVGGRSLLALSAEVRTKITDTISVVGFFDIAAIDRSQFVDGDSPFHSGAGLGVRYDLGGLGPLRLDLALPVDGDTGDGLQFYLGIGQAF